MVRSKIFIFLMVAALTVVSCKAFSGMIGAAETDTSSGETSSGETSSGKEISGAQVFKDMGCWGCHEGNSAGIAPSLDGLYGEEVRLEDGESVVADEAYLRESILAPKAKLVAGYQPIMPDFRGELSDEEVEALVAYIRSLGE